MSDLHRSHTSGAFLARRAACLALLAGASLLGAPAALAESEAPVTTSVVRPSADTYVDAARPWAAHGKRLRLRASAARRRAYLRFDVRGLGEIESATLSLRAVGGRTGAFEVRRARNTGWREWRMTFRTSPRAVKGSPRARGYAHGGWTTVDVTALVRGGGRVTLVIVPRSAQSRLAFTSRESIPAQLRVSAKKPAAPGGTAPPAPGETGGDPAPAHTFADRVGFSGSNVWYDSSKQLSYLTKLRSSGVNWLREDFHWGAFEQSPGSWNWTVGDRLMRNASLTGMNILGIFAYSSGWGADGPTIYHPPKDPHAYANFCRKVVERYGPGGAFWALNPDLEPRPLTAVEIWNEPWLSFFWRPNPEPLRYATLVRTASQAIKAAQPGIKVLASADIFQMRSDTTQSLDWFRLLLEADAALFRDHVDVLSVHAYAQNRSPLDTKTAQRWRYDRVLMTRDLAAQHNASKPIWITEFGWTTESGSAEAVSEALQAQYTQQALELAVTSWGSFVEKAFVYYWGEPADAYTAGYSPLRPGGGEKPLWGTLTALLGGS